MFHGRASRKYVRKVVGVRKCLSPCAPPLKPHEVVCRMSFPPTSRGFSLSSRIKNLQLWSRHLSRGHHELRAGLHRLRRAGGARQHRARGGQGGPSMCPVIHSCNHACIHQCICVTVNSCLSVCLAACMSVCLSVCLSVCPYVKCMSVCAYVCMYFHSCACVPVTHRV